MRNRTMARTFYRLARDADRILYQLSPTPSNPSAVLHDTPQSEPRDSYQLSIGMTTINADNYAKKKLDRRDPSMFDLMETRLSHIS